MLRLGHRGRYPAKTLTNPMEIALQPKNESSGFSIRDMLVFTAIISLATVLYIGHNPLGYFPFMAAIYFAGWKMLNLPASRLNRIVMMALSIALVSPLLLWYSSPETRAFNVRIGYQWNGSYAYPFFSLLPIPFLFFVWKCFRPKMTAFRYVIESCCECMLAIPLFTLFVVGL